MSSLVTPAANIVSSRVAPASVARELEPKENGVEGLVTLAQAEAVAFDCVGESLGGGDGCPHHAGAALGEGA